MVDVRDHHITVVHRLHSYIILVVILIHQLGRHHDRLISLSVECYACKREKIYKHSTFTLTESRVAGWLEWRPKNGKHSVGHLPARWTVAWLGQTGCGSQGDVAQPGIGLCPTMSCNRLSGLYC